MDITLEKLGKKFGEVKAVDEVSFKIRDGEFFFILGSSGCGKTTLLRLIAGFYTPEGGSLRFGGSEVNNVPPNRRNTGMVFQNYALWPHMTVFDNVAYGLKVRKMPTDETRREVENILETVRMQEYAQRFPNQLSGGQQQRVALARALVIKPDILLMDEPLSNLDAKLRMELRDEIKRIQRETNVTALYVTHDQKEAMAMADRIAVMKDGKILQVDSPREVYSRPQSRFVAAFMGEVNRISGKVIERGDGFVKIETALGILVSKNIYGKFNTGDSVEAMVRPESMTITSDGDFNRFEGVVESSIYLGQVEEFFIKSKNDINIKMITQVSTQREYKPGESLFLSFPPESLHVIKD
jgi:iron(III) transport system ATP-binding protein